MQIPLKLAQARHMAAEKRPYYAHAIFAMVPRVTTLFDTMAVDFRWNLYYNQKFLDDYSVPELAGVVVHEVEHLLRIHHERCGSTKPDVWNIAVDLEINDDILASGLDLPQGVLIPKLFGLPNNLLAEEYLERIKVTTITVPDQRAGSGSDGHRREWEEHCEEGDDEDGNGISKSRRDMIRRQTAEEVRNARSTKPGSVPGGIERWAEEILNPRVDWRKELAAVIRNAVRKVMGQSDYTYRRPSRRQSAVTDVVLPAMDKYLPSVAVVVDTSGSMSARQLAQGLAEIKGVLNALGHGERIVVFSVDAQASACQAVFSPKQVKLTGGGGTDMGVGIAAAAQHRPTPNIIIVFTDGFTPWPEKAPPRSKVTICICSDKAPPTPSWASTVRVPVAEER